LPNYREIIVILSLLSGTAAFGQEGATSKAQNCSEAALHRYALSSTETAHEIAQAAYDKCATLWGDVAQEMAGPQLPGETGQEFVKRLLAYDHAAQQQFLTHAAVEVFDIRADAAGK